MKRIVQINGVSVEFDDRDATSIQTFRIGDTVKVLTKSYGDSFRVRPGVIVGMTAFTNLPSIEVAVLELTHDGAKLEIIAINSQSKDTEIAAVDAVELQLSREHVTGLLDREIERLETQLRDRKAHKALVLNRFGAYMLAHDEASGKQPV